MQAYISTKTRMCKIELASAIYSGHGSGYTGNGKRGLEIGQEF